MRAQPYTHIYCGDGKGLPRLQGLRCAVGCGCGMKVLFAQFMKKRADPERSTAFIDMVLRSCAEKAIQNLRGKWMNEKRRLPAGCRMSSSKAAMGGGLRHGCAG